MQQGRRDRTKGQMGLKKEIKGKGKGKGKRKGKGKEEEGKRNEWGLRCYYWLEIGNW